MTVVSNEVREVIHAVRAIHDIGTPNAQRHQFTQAIETLKESDPCSTVPLAFQLVGNEDPFVRHVGWNIIEHVIKYKWIQLNVELRITIRNAVLDHVSSGSFTLTGVDSHIKTAVSRSVVGMMEHEWPQNWPELFPQFQAIVANPKLPTQCHMVFLILKRLMENVVTLTTIEAPGRKKDLNNAINLCMPQILEMTIARIRLCISEGTNENTVLLAKSAIELLSEIVEWVIGRVLEDVVDDIINVVCAYLRTDMCGIYEEAAKCLWKLASRKRAKTDETPIVVSMFKETPMQTILSAASVAADVSSSSAEHYKYLKALCDLLCSLGVHLSEVWGYIKNPPPNFNLYLTAISSLFAHPSIYIRAETSNVIVTFSAHQHISETQEFSSCIDELLKFIPRSMEKAGAPSESNSLTSHYSSMDYEDDLEFFHDYIQLRDRCCRIVSENTQKHFSRLLQVLTEWVSDRCLAKAVEVRKSEWDSMKRYITAFLPTAYRLDMVDQTIDGTFLSLFDGVLRLLTTLSDASLINEVLSILSAFFQVLNAHPDRIPPMLSLMKALLAIDNPDNVDQEVTSMKRHCTSLLLKLVSSFSSVIKDYAGTILDVVVSVADRVSVMQRASLVQVLAGLSNLASSAEEQHRFLQSAIQLNIQYLLSEPVTTAVSSTPNFLTYIGLRSPAPATEAEARATVFYENRLSLKSNLNTIEGVIQQVNAPEDKSNPLFPLLHPVIPSVFQLVRCVNSIYDPVNLALIHPSYAAKVVEITASDRQQIWCSIMDTTEPPSQANSQQADSTFHLRRFVGDITDSVQAIVGYIGSKLYYDFYALPNASELMMSTMFAIDQVPDFRVRFWIKRGWSRLILSCPMERMATIVPLTSALTRHLFTLVTNRWSTVEKVDYDSEPSEEEIFLEHMTCILSREVVGFLKSFVFGEGVAKEDRKRPSEVMNPFAERLLKERVEILESVIAILFSFVYCPDTQTAIKSVPIASVIVTNFGSILSEQLATFMLVQGIRSLQVHGSDDVALGPLLSLVFLVYSSLRPAYPSFVDILRQVPDTSEENLAAFDNRVLAMLQNNEKLVDKNKRDLMRKVLRPVIALRIGERHKRPVQLRPLKPIEKRQKPEEDNVFPIHTLFA